ncbi:hypothetical protein L218DRAFT_1079536 [Marasmius fiardii PR-910]|nr:hypothetical protein L218DRAFT_1079536 [Marasmius fiardii PR-910]
MSEIHQTGPTTGPNLVSFSRKLHSNFEILYVTIGSQLDFLRFFLCLVLNFSSSVQALPETRTIDDAFGDLANPDIQTPIYNGNWIARRGPECSNSTGCSVIVPDNANLIVNGTWHEGLHSPKGSNSSDTHPEPSTLHLSFNGTALSVFCILPARTIIGGGGTSYIVWPLYLNFILDGHPAGSFNRTPDQLTDTFQYNVSVFSRKNLENKAHTFIMELDDPTLDSFVLFDYASYVYENGVEGENNVAPVTPVKSEVNSQVFNHSGLIGGVVSGVVGGIVSLFLLYWAKPIIEVGAEELGWTALRRRRDLKKKVSDALKATEYSYRYNSSAQPSYLKLFGDTRSQYVYGVLSDWAHTRITKKGVTGVYWLQGSDCVWRSALAQKLAKECEGKELLATFFFSTKDPNRNHPRFLALAIVHEMLTTGCLGTRVSILQMLALRYPTSLDNYSLNSQFAMLVTGTSNWRTKLYDAFRFPSRIMKASSTLIVLNGLDECGSDQEQDQVLSYIYLAMTKKLPVRFLVCSRPTDYLQKRFSHLNLRCHTKIVSLDSDWNTPLATRKIKAVNPRVADESLSMA